MYITCYTEEEELDEELGFELMLEEAERERVSLAGTRIIKVWRNRGKIALDATVCVCY